MYIHPQIIVGREWMLFSGDENKKIKFSFNFLAAQEGKVQSDFFPQTI
jgi:hypothetical protein